MTGIDGQHFLTGFQIVLPSVKFNAKEVRNNSVLPSFQGPVRGDNGGNAAEIAPTPASSAYGHSLSASGSVCHSTAPFGGGVDYGSDFVGRYAIRDVTLAGVVQVQRARAQLP